MQGQHNYNPYQAPRANTDDALPQAQQFPGIPWLLFSLRGRIARRHYWGGLLGMCGAVGAAIGFLAGIAGAFSALGHTSSATIETTAGLITAGITWIVLIPFMWAIFALDVKRWHDRGKSGVWVLLRLVPIIGGIWTFIELGCMQGVPGSNIYGDPR